MIKPKSYRLKKWYVLWSNNWFFRNLEW